MQRNPVDPGTQTRVPVEARNTAKDLYKYILGYVSGGFRIAQAARYQGVHRMTILRDEESKCLLRARFELGNEALLFMAPIDCSDSECTRQIAHSVLCTSAGLKPERAIKVGPPDGFVQSP
jgi:hypothetical protein